MSDLSQHFSALRTTFSAAFADKKVTFQETLQLAGAIVGTAACVMDRVSDRDVNALVTEAEALYDELLDPAVIDIPKVPEWAEAYVLRIGKQAIRPAIEKLVDALNGD